EEPADTPLSMTISAVSICLNEDRELQVSVPITGQPGAAVQPAINGATGGTTLTELDGDGVATTTLRPTVLQILINAPVELTYVDDTSAVPYRTSLGNIGVNVASATTAPLCPTQAEPPSPAE